MNVVIDIRNISKAYSIIRPVDYYFTLRDTLTNIVRSPRRFFKGRAGQLIGHDTAKTFWALKNVSLRIKRGEIVGVIGPNGAGKSTLLKILNRITVPTAGELVVHGKISSLLEVGTGFHPELTGRENIFFSGAILGMKRREIIRKFNDIVRFAELEQFLDTPVKRYSSGMNVRLGFSVAAHLEPDLMLIDEVLAVGDIRFQKKCLAKIHDVAKKDGRTILFVSHNLDAVQNLCDRVVYLEKGQVQMVGPADEVIQAYLKQQTSISEKAARDFSALPHKPFQIRKVIVKNADNLPTTNLSVGRPFTVEVFYDVNQAGLKFWLTVQCLSEYGSTVFFSRDSDKNPHLLTPRKQGNFVSIFRFPANQSFSLNQGRYSLIVRIEQDPDSEVTLPIHLEDQMKKFHHHPGVVLVGEPWLHNEQDRRL